MLEQKREHGLFLLVLACNRVLFVETTHLCAKIPCIYRVNSVWIKLLKIQSENYLSIFVHALVVFFLATLTCGDRTCLTSVTCDQGREGCISLLGLL